MSQKRYWLGDPPMRCDINTSHRIKDEFVDGRTRMGPWANMCPSCARTIGVGLGTGKGQRYQREPDGRFAKVEG